MHLKELVIRVPPPPEGTDLKFPEIFCKDIHLFDKLVARMRQGSEQNEDDARDRSNLPSGSKSNDITSAT